jgi:hypothetical protein
MHFNIITKYDLGDYVYIAEFYDEYIPSKELTVATIEFSVSANKTKVVYYLNDGDDYKGYYSEEMLFATCAECTEWCDKHNKNS